VGQASGVHRLMTASASQHSNILSQNRAEWTPWGGALPPQTARRGESARCAYALLTVATLLCATGGGPAAWAGTGRQPAGDSAHAESSSHFLAVTILGSAVRVDGDWDSGFGGEIALGSLTERHALAAWAASVDFVAYSERSGGRAALELAAGTRWPAGLLVGVAAGPVVEVDDVRRPRAGGQASIWLFAGVVPYARVGAVEKGGAFVDLGLRIPLPVWRW